ncbi:MAG: DoxX family protein [Nonlabens sp.]
MKDELLDVPLINLIPYELNLPVGLIFILLPLASLVLKRYARLLVGLSIVAYLGFLVFDISRVTPYFICYLGMFYLLAVDGKPATHHLVLLASGIYIFSGLHKLNDGFYDQILKGLWFYSISDTPPTFLATVAPLFEVMCGVGLYFKFSRRYAVYALIGLHVLLLWKLGPWKYNWNLIVWPWNFMMIVALIAILKQTSDFKGGSFKMNLSTIPILLSFYLLPASSMFLPNLSNLGFQLYTGNVLYAELELPITPADLEAFDRENDKSSTCLNLQLYSIRKRELAVNAEPWVYRQIQRNFERYYQTTSSLQFFNNKFNSLEP